MHFCGCSQPSNNPATITTENTSVKEQLINANHARVEVENERIEAFIKRRGLKMEKTGTGLRYLILQQGEGNFAQEGQTVLLNFKVSLLDGKVCYSSDEVGPQQFNIGNDNVESGLHEGIQLLKPGGKAKFILPSHLAHGLSGDAQKIPANATIIYDVELLAIQ